MRRGVYGSRLDTEAQDWATRAQYTQANLQGPSCRRRAGGLARLVLPLLLLPLFLLLLPLLFLCVLNEMVSEKGVMITQPPVESRANVREQTRKNKNFFFLGGGRGGETFHRTGGKEGGVESSEYAMYATSPSRSHHTFHPHTDKALLFAFSSSSLPTFRHQCGRPGPLGHPPWEKPRLLFPVEDTHTHTRRHTFQTDRQTNETLRSYLLPLPCRPFVVSVRHIREGEGRRGGGGRGPWRTHHGRSPLLLVPIGSPTHTYMHTHTDKRDTFFLPSSSSLLTLRHQCQTHPRRRGTRGRGRPGPLARPPWEKPSAACPRGEGLGESRRHRQNHPQACGG